jgi:hypothetical protein
VEGTDALVKSVVRLTGFATIWVKWKDSDNAQLDFATT